MKNFKLLLATTAILSVICVMNTKAGSLGPETTIVPVYIDFVSPKSLNLRRALSFGRISGSNVNSMTITMDNTGHTEITAQESDWETHAASTAYILDQGSTGQVYGSGITSCSHISLPESVTLSHSAGGYSGNGNEDDVLSAYTLTNLGCNFTNGNAEIFGTLTLNAGYRGGNKGQSFNISEGRISGQFVVTAVYDDRDAAPTPLEP